MFALALLAVIKNGVLFGSRHSPRFWPQNAPVEYCALAETRQKICVDYEIGHKGDGLAPEGHWENSSEHSGREAIERTQKFVY